MILTALLTAAAGLSAGVVRAILSGLFAGEVRASLAEHLKRRVQDAAAELDTELAADMEEEWLLELESLRDRPIRALLFVRGLRRAAVCMSDDVRRSATGETREAPAGPVTAVATRRTLSGPFTANEGSRLFSALDIHHKSSENHAYGWLVVDGVRLLPLHYSLSNAAGGSDVRERIQRALHLAPEEYCALLDGQITLDDYVTLYRRRS